MKNVVSLGLAAGFLEPLESTSIHLVQSAIKRLVTFFPTRDFNPLVIDEYNRLTRTEWEGIRDFIVLHYCATERTDTEFWKYCSAMEVPELLQRVMDHFRSAGRFACPATNLFTKPSWFAVFMGQFIEPAGYHPWSIRGPEWTRPRTSPQSPTGSTAPSTACPNMATSSRATARHRWPPSRALWRTRPVRPKTVLPRGAADAQLRSVHRVPARLLSWGPSAPTRRT